MELHADLSIDIFCLPSRLQVGEHGHGIPLGYYKKANQWAELIPLESTVLERKELITKAVHEAAEFL